MSYLPHAASIRLKYMAENNKAVMGLYTDLEAAVLEGSGSVELDVINLPEETKLDFINALELLGYEVSSSYGDDIVHVYF